MKTITKISYKGYSIQFSNNHTALIYKGETFVKGIASGYLHGEAISSEKAKAHIDNNLV